MDELQTRPAGQRPRWYQRVLPVTGLVLALLALAAVVSPAFRHQVALSTSRQPQPFVELYFWGAGHAGHAGKALCGRQVRFTVVSHLEETRTLTYRVTVGGEDGRPGSIRIRPGETRDVTTRVSPPPEPHTVAVRIPDLDQHLLAHCGGGQP